MAGRLRVDRACVDPCPILQAYITVAMSRSEAMKALELDWYGDLLMLMNRHQVAKPDVSAADAAAMDSTLRQVLR